MTAIYPIQDLTQVDVLANPSEVHVNSQPTSVTSTTQTSPVEVKSDSITILSVGLQGPQGPTGPAGEEDMPYDKEVDVSADGLTMYIGEAAVGSSTASAVWRIKRIIFNAEGDSSTKWADGDSNFDNIWDDRVTLSY